MKYDEQQWAVVVTRLIVDVAARVRGLARFPPLFVPSVPISIFLSVRPSAATDVAAEAFLHPAAPARSLLSPFSLRVRYTEISLFLLVTVGSSFSTTNTYRLLSFVAAHCSSTDGERDGFPPCTKLAFCCAISIPYQEKLQFWSRVSSRFGLSNLSLVSPISAMMRSHTTVAAPLSIFYAQGQSTMLI